LTAKKAEFGRRSAELQRKVRDLQTHFWELESHLVFYAPIGVVDDTVVVHPLQWTTR
jgi:hypothetical protein